MSLNPQLEQDFEVAKRCLYKCPFRETFERYMEGRKTRYRELIDNPQLSSINEINFVRGALAQLEDVSKIPKFILQLEAKLEKNQQKLTQRKVAGKTKLEEITA